MPWNPCVIRVAVAIISNAEQRILVTQRPLHAPHGGYWEFPGGKLETNELPEQALVREIKEELGLEVLAYQLLGEVNHQYSERTVQLIIFLVTQFSGTPECMEGQLAMKWLKKNEFNPQEFPAANHKIIELIPGYL